MAEPTDDQAKEDISISSLEDISSFLTDQIGPDKNAIERFLWKETDKFELVNLRLNELLILLEGVVTAQALGEPKELCTHLQSVFSSIDAICSFVYDVKNRLMQLEKEVDRRKPNKLIGFMKKMARVTDQPLDLNTITFDTDNMLNQYGISFQENQQKDQSLPEAETNLPVDNQS